MDGDVTARENKSFAQEPESESWSLSALTPRLFSHSHSSTTVHSLLTPPKSLSVPLHFEHLNWSFTGVLVVLVERQEDTNRTVSVVLDQHRMLFSQMIKLSALTGSELSLFSEHSYFSECKELYCLRLHRGRPVVSHHHVMDVRKHIRTCLGL